MELWLGLGTGTLEGKKKEMHLVQSLAPALTLNYLANKPQPMTSTLFGLLYLTNGSTTDYKYLRMPLCTEKQARAAAYILTRNASIQCSQQLHER